MMNKYLYIQRSDDENWNSELQDIEREEKVLKELETYGSKFKSDDYNKENLI